MRYLKTIILFVFSMSLSNLTGQEIPSFSDSLKQVEIALLGSLRTLDEQEQKVTLLEAQLKEAKESSLNSDRKIAALEKSLAEAKSQVAALKQIVIESEAELARLLRLSGTLERTIKDNEENHLSNLEKVRKAHLAETLKIRIGSWIKLGLGVGIGILIGGGISYYARTR